MELENNKLYDQIVGTIIQNVLAESNRADGKIVLWDFQAEEPMDRLYYHVACMAADLFDKPIYLEMQFFDYLKFKIKNKKRKNLHWVWRKHTSLPDECKTSIFFILEHVSNYYEVPIEIFEEINKEYYENTNN